MSSQALFARARTALFNQNEVTQAVCDVAYGEAIELTNAKPIPMPMLLDLAYMRLKLHLKVPTDELEEKLAFLAIKTAEKMFITTDSSGKPSATNTGVQIKERGSEWDM